MATEPCDSVALCGISVRFQTLFHTQRQVAHALLTRPPLSYLNASRRINQNNSVRLECVMHAASVHPEPGSNSRNHCIKTQTCVCGSIAFEFLLLALYFCLSSILILRIVRDPFAHTFICFVLLSCCSIFKDQRPRLRGDLLIIPHPLHLVKPFLHFS